jgi:hypothetical protein
MLADALTDAYGLVGDLAHEVDYAHGASRRLWHGRAQVGDYNHPDMNAIAVNGAHHGVFHQATYGRSRCVFARDRLCRGFIILYPDAGEYRHTHFKRGLMHGACSQYLALFSTHQTRFDKTHGITIYDGRAAEFFWRAMRIALAPT